MAQQFTVSVSIRNPTPTLLQEWSDNPSIVQVVLTNQSSTSRQVVIGINLTNTSNRRTVSSINDHPCMPTFVINSGETKIVNGSELICQEALKIPPDIRTSVITSGQLPEGDYEFCVTVIDAND